MSELGNTIKVYLDDLFKVSANTELELEVKFGTRGIKPIGRIDYENVIKRLLSYGFIATGTGVLAGTGAGTFAGAGAGTFAGAGGNKYLLRIQNQYTDINTGVVRLSNIRTEISGIQNIQQYCKTNRLDGIVDGGLMFIQKELHKQKQSQNKSQQMPLYPVNIDDYNFRLSLSSEQIISKTSPIVKDTLEKWNDNKKTFRYLNRYSLKHPDLPFIIDLSIVKESKKEGKEYIPEYNFQDSGVLSSDEKYEIEIECINSLVGIGTAFSTPVLLEKAINKVVKYVLSGLQETNYPVGYSEQKSVLTDYMNLLWNGGKKNIKDKDKENRNAVRVIPKNFVGPSSYTLELQNIMPLSADSTAPNIQKNYTVTDKADGDRKLLYIAPETGKIYLINTNMSVQFTGAITRNKDLFNTLLDGEHILYNKSKQFINLYTAFDIYYIKGEDVRGKAFIPGNDVQVQAQVQEQAEANNDEKKKATSTANAPILTNFRLPLLVSLIKKLAPESIIKKTGSATPLPSPLRIDHKKFYSTSESQTIFQGCKLILEKVADGLFEYNTDGLIFTPALLGVGANKPGEVIKPMKTTWNYSFKWKPVEMNTIDFLISVKKLANGADYIGNTFETGLDMRLATQLTQYKTVILRVGFDESKHGYINPCQDIIDGNVTGSGDLDDEDTYKPVQFFPTQPSDPHAGIANILLEQGRSDEKVMLTEEKEVIEDNMIVEFSYDASKTEQWCWKPLRVRYDKTAEFRAGMKNFGNAYHVANSNWRTIHNPITEEMIMTGDNIPTELENAGAGDDEVYYNRTSSVTSTQALRDFHNRYVKKILLNSVAKRGDTLIDLAVGKGGDFPKWIAANLKFVFGVDISRDNIQNRLDGACARFLNFKKNTKVMPDALFVTGNSSVNIRNANALYSEKDKQITRAVFGEGPKDLTVLGKGVYKEYGIGHDGFDICSIQFAIHYMFENQTTLQNFLRNVSEVTKVGGYFIGTSYDGKMIFNMLRGVKEDEKLTISSSVAGSSVAGSSVAGSSVAGSGLEGSKIWEVTKRYDRTDFSDNVSCLGYKIDVYQESINKTFPEYLVNYDYLTQLLENYGFVLLKRDELLKKDKDITTMTESTGLFADLFTKMNGDIKRNPRLSREFKEAANMTAGERQISFLNRYFIYKKVRKVDTENVFLGLTNKTVAEEKDEEDVTKRAQEQVREAVQAVAKPVKVKGKMKKTLKLVEEI
jgi:hypothetical protein